MLCTDTLTLSLFHSPTLALSSASTQSFSFWGTVLQPAEYEGQVQRWGACTSFSQGAKRVTEAARVWEGSRLVRPGQVLFSPCITPLRPPPLPIIPRRPGQSKPEVGCATFCLASRSFKLRPRAELTSPAASAGGSGKKSGDPRHHLAEEAATLQSVSGGPRSAKPPPPPARLPLLASTMVPWLHQGASTNTN